MSAIKDQVVLVTGSSRGLGKAIAEAFLREGATVVINFVASDRLDVQLAFQEWTRAWTQDQRLPRPLFERADVTNKGQVEQLFANVYQTLGRSITTVVNNALPGNFSFNGDARPKVDTLQWSQVQAQLDGAVQGALNVVQAALPHFRQAGFGRVINIGTNLVQNPVVPYHDYTLAKGALLALTRTLAKDLGPEGVTINLVAGGLLRTTDASSGTPDKVFDLIAKSTPLGHVTTPQELSDAVLFFASPWSRAVTGQQLVVDGGLVFN